MHASCYKKGRTLHAQNKLCSGENKKKVVYNFVVILMAPAFYLLFICSIFSLFTHNDVAAALPKFSSILIFGDSLLDTGNNNFIPTLLKANHAPYGISFPGGVPTGRFSDGKLMSDFLAEALGIKDTVPPFLDPNLGPNDIRTGVCFASAGSGYDDFTALVSRVIPVTKQYNEYFQIYKRKLIGIVGVQEAISILNNSFVFATSGSNDMTISFYSGAPRRLEYSTLDQYQDFLLRRVRDFIKVIYISLFLIYLSSN